MLIVVYGYDYCPYTRDAAALAGVEIRAASQVLECDPRARLLASMRREVRSRGHRTIPMCFDMHRRTNRFIGGLAELRPYLAKRRTSGR